MTTISDVLLMEHAVLRMVFEQAGRLLEERDGLAEAKLMAVLLERLLTVHAKNEADLPFAALDHILEEKGLLRQLHQDHHEMDGRFKKAQNATTATEARRLLAQAASDSIKHFQHEEKDLLPLIERMLQPETRSQLAETWLRRTRGA